MVFLCSAVFFLIMIFPSDAFAWGPMTHVYLATEVLNLPALATILAPSVYALLQRYREDFIYGNLMADSIIAKKHVPLEKHPHNWDVAASLLDDASVDHEQAFCLGYLCHLAADTVAHGPFTHERTNMVHALMEFRADSFVQAAHWQKAVTITPSVRKRGDAFLNGRLQTVFLSFSTNAMLFRSSIAVSGVGRMGRNIKEFSGMNSALTQYGSSEEIECMQQDSLQRMVEILTDPRNAPVRSLDPVGSLRPGRFMKLLLSGSSRIG